MLAFTSCYIQEYEYSSQSCSQIQFDRYTTKIFLNCVCRYCKKDHGIIQNNSPIERRIPPYELLLTNCSWKMKNCHYQQIRAFQTYLSWENNTVTFHFATDRAHSTGTPLRLKQCALSSVHWQQPRAWCLGFKGGFTESWCPLVTIRSLSSKKDTKSNSFFHL